MKISVLVCTYGDVVWAEKAARAIKSAEGQGAHERVALHETNESLAQVRNKAAERATGDWLCFLDADDRLEYGYLDAMRRAEHLTRYDMSGPFENHRLLVPSVSYVSQVEQTTPSIPSWGRPLIEVNCAVIGTLVKRDSFMQVGGFREWPMYEDWDLWLRCVKASNALVPVRDAIYLASVPGTRNVQPHISSETYWAIRQQHERGWV